MPPPPGTRHPRPKEKSAKSCLKKVLTLGLNGLENLPFPYWEPRLEGETPEQHYSRRVCEGKAFSTWFKMQTNNKTKPEVGASTAPSTSCSDTEPEQDMDVEEPTRKRPQAGDFESGDEPGRKRQLGPSTLKGLLAKEEKARIAAESQLASLRDELQGLRQSIDRLTDMLAREQAEKETMRAELAALRRSSSNAPPEVTPTTVKVTRAAQASSAPAPAAPPTVQAVNEGASTTTSTPGSLPGAANVVNSAISIADIEGVVQKMIAPLFAILEKPIKQQPAKPQHSRPQQQQKQPAQQQSQPQQQQRQLAWRQKQPQTPANQREHQNKQQPPRRQQQQQQQHQQQQQSTPLFSQIVGNGPTASYIRNKLTKEAAEAEAQQISDSSPFTTVSSRRARRKARSNNSAGGPEVNKKPKRLPKAIPEDNTTVLLLPGNDCPNVIKKLQKVPEADPLKLGVKRQVQFPSGAALVTCHSEHQATLLRTIAQNIGIREKLRNPRSPQIRIHDIPGNVSNEEAGRWIERGFGEAPLEVLSFPYRTTNQDDEEATRFAVVSTSMELYRKMSERRSVRIGWQMCRIDASIKVRRCNECGLLGHSEARCAEFSESLVRNASAGVGANGAGSNHEANNECRDCSAFNRKRITSASTSGASWKPRPTAHETGSKTCPTLIAFRKKALPILPKQPPASRSSQPVAPNVSR